jgi:hypothetical protein
LRSKRRRLLTGCLLVLALVGAASSLYYGRQVRQLERDRAELAEQVGLLEVTDPRRVHLRWVPTDNFQPPPGVELAYLWRFRIYTPANYGPCWITRSGAIAADSPRNRGGGGGSWGAKNKDPEESMLTVAIIKANDRWVLSRINQGSSSTRSLPESLELDKLNDLIIEPVVDLKTPGKSFGADQPICLLRIRSEEPVESKEGEPALYPGVVYYLVESDRRPDFQRWADGDLDSMPEPSS